MERKAEISVIIPCYNQAEYLGETLESLLGQTYENWEAILVNDASTDHTEEVALEYVAKDTRFKYIAKENGGVSSARNVGICRASGKYILPLDSDDLIEKSYIEKALNVFTEMPDVKIVYCWASYFGVKSGEWSWCRYQGYKDLLLGNKIFCSAVFRKEDCVNIGGYDEAMLWGFEDWEFYIRLLDADSVVFQIPQPLFFYRVKEMSRSVTASLNEQKINIYIYAKNRGKYVTVFGEEMAVIKELVYYKKREEKRRNRWWRCVFRNIKRCFNVLSFT